MAWTHRFVATTELPAEYLWPVLVDVAGWPACDPQIERIEVEGEVRAGSTFTLKPRGGPTLRFEVAELTPPARWADRCRMPGAVMTTTHALHAAEQTTIEVTIQITGPLARVWGWLVGRQHARGLPAQTDRFVAEARRRLAD